MIKELKTQALAARPQWYCINNYNYYLLGPYFVPGTEKGPFIH